MLLFGNSKPFCDFKIIHVFTLPGYESRPIVLNQQTFNLFLCLCSFNFQGHFFWLQIFCQGDLLFQCLLSNCKLFWQRRYLSHFLCELVFKFCKFLTLGSIFRFSLRYTKLNSITVYLWIKPSLCEILSLSSIYSTTYIHQRYSFNLPLYRTLHIYICMSIFYILVETNIGW